MKETKQTKKQQKRKKFTKKQCSIYIQELKVRGVKQR